MWAGRCPQPHHVPAQAESLGLTVGLSVPTWSRGTSGQPETFIPCSQSSFLFTAARGAARSTRAGSTSTFFCSPLSISRTLLCTKGKLLSSSSSCSVPSGPCPCPILLSAPFPCLSRLHSWWTGACRLQPSPPQTPAGGEKPLGGWGAGAAGSEGTHGSG